MSELTSSTPEVLRSKFYLVPDIVLGMGDIDINATDNKERESVMAKKSANVSTLAISREDVLGRGIREAKVEDIKIGGKPGTIYYRPLSVRTILEFMEIENNSERIKRTVTLLSVSWTDADGNPMFTEDELYDKVGIGSLTSVMNAIVGGSSAKNA
jgi:hypothetical protein